MKRKIYLILSIMMVLWIMPMGVKANTEVAETEGISIDADICPRFKRVEE